jgi:hypothetical protein
MHFGRIDKTDFLIPPFDLFYFYTVFAAAVNLSIVSTQGFFHSEVISWLGVFLCFGGLISLLLVWQEFSRWHRCSPFRQACNVGRICLKPQSYLFCGTNSLPAFGCSTGRYCAKKNS